MDRREFLKGASRVLLVLPFGTFLLASCKDDDGTETEQFPTDPNDETPPDAPPKVVGTNTIYTSSQINDHSHGFTVPEAAFANPPVGGIMGRTTEAQAHQHSLTIDQEALRRAASGEIVKIETSLDAEHTHMFTIVKAG